MGPVFLFDIDLTLLRSNGAGSAAMTQTLHELVGVEDGFAGMHFGGRTDRSLLREALTRCGQPDTEFDRFCVAFEQRYVGYLERELPVRRAELLPGARAAIDEALKVPGARVGLATGNFRRAARAKLDHFGLWGHFLDGGFAEDGEHRNDLVAAAIRRVAGPGWHGPVYVIGDSVHDITAAVANGAVAVGVCTGGDDEATLRQAGAHAVFADLSAPGEVLRQVLALPSA